MFLGWFDAETGGSLVTSIDTGTYGNLALYAHWSPTYRAAFMSQGELYQSFELVASSSITQPTPDPVKASDSKYDYTFSHWDGYTPGMTMGDSDVTFNAVFIKSGRIVTESGKLKVNVDENRVLLTKEKIDMVVSMADSDRDLTMTVDLDNCKVSFDNAALRSLKSSNTELSVLKKTDAEKTADEKRIAGDGPVYEMTFGDNTDFKGGKVTFTIPYEITDGKSADDLYIAYISDGEVMEEIECDYEGGSVSFSTGHLSVYTMLYREVKDTNFLQDLSLGGFLIFGLIFAIAASALILAILKKTK